MKPLATALNHEREAAAADAMLDVFHDVLRYERETPLGVLQPTTLNAIVGLVKKQLEEDGKRTAERRQAAADDDDDEPDEDELEAEFNLLDRGRLRPRDPQTGGAQALPTLETQLMPHINGWMPSVGRRPPLACSGVRRPHRARRQREHEEGRPARPQHGAPPRHRRHRRRGLARPPPLPSAPPSTRASCQPQRRRRGGARARRIVTAADAKCAANVGASETALAIGKLVVHRGAALGAAAQESLQTFLEWFPLRSEDEEAQAAMRCLTVSSTPTPPP